MSSFAVSTQSFVFAGLLTELAADLSVSVAQAGQLATVFALAFGLSAPPLAAALARVPRRRLIVLAQLALAAANLAIAFADDLGTMLWLRVAAGMAGAVVVPAASATAAAMAPPQRRARALALVIGGVTAAFVLGIPLGSAVGGVFGWRACFVFSAVLALAAALAVGLGLPDVSATDAPGGAGLRVVRRPAVLRMLALTFLGFTATFCFSTYIGPATNRVAGLAGAEVALMQVLVGVASMAGVPLGARIADRLGVAGAWPLFGGIALGQVIHAVLLVAGLPHLPGGIAQGAAIVLGAGCLFALSPIVQAQLVGQAPDARGVVLAFNSSTIFLGQAAGAGLGGLAIALSGLPAVGVAGAAVGLLGLILALRLPATRAS